MIIINQERLFPKHQVYTYLQQVERIPFPVTRWVLVEVLYAVRDGIVHKEVIFR